MDDIIFDCKDESHEWLESQPFGDLYCKTCEDKHTNSVMLDIAIKRAQGRDPLAELVASWEVN